MQSGRGFEYNMPTESTDHKYEGAVGGECESELLRRQQLERRSLALSPYEFQTFRTPPFSFLRCCLHVNPAVFALLPPIG